ncbi:hypothetical protein EGW08_000795 [Elysia chlorotica]|uniref:N-acetyltransferase domain-containing protein n=1 Tax=Elysia chlorotica TaxID=188477 RepID=A0A3S1BUA5_ELYCH|nr:hypothetical protein EGW08_000795 [Elysia chlorotica]
MVTSFDGGRSVMRRAARVHEDYRGRGIYRRLEQELENYIRDHCPNAQYVSICKNEKDHMFHSRYLAQDFHQVYKREGTQMLVKAANIKSLDSNDHISDHDMIQTRAISADELKLLIRSEEIKKKLFPDNRLLNFYLSYRPMEENVRHLICERGGAFVSLDTDFHNINDVRNRDFQEGNDILPGTHDKYDIKEFSHTPIHVSRPPKGSHSNSQPHQQLLSPETINNVAMVTFYYCYPTAGKPCYFFDAYAKPGLRSPGDHFRSHLRENVLTLRKFFPDQDAVLPLTFDPSIPRDEVMSGLSEVGIVDEKPDAEKWQILYERRQRY